MKGQKALNGQLAESLLIVWLLAARVQVARQVLESRIAQDGDHGPAGSTATIRVP